jgi:hypothetical protein
MASAGPRRPARRIQRRSRSEVVEERSNSLRSCLISTRLQPLSLPTTQEDDIGSESQRESVPKPRVAESARLPWVTDRHFGTTPTGLRPASRHERRNPVGVENGFHPCPQGSSRTRNPGLSDTIPSGLPASVRGDVDNGEALSRVLIGHSNFEIVTKSSPIHLQSEHC